MNFGSLIPKRSVNPATQLPSVCERCVRPRGWAVAFAEILDHLPLAKPPLLQRFEALIAPQTDGGLEALAQESRALTRQNFGRTIATTAGSPGIIRSCVSR